MKTGIKRVEVIGMVILVIGGTMGTECPSRRKTGPAVAGEVQQEAYTMPLSGYEQSVDVKAPAAEVFQAISDPERFGLTTFRIDRAEMNRIFPPEGPPELGSSAEGRLRIMGVDITGRLIVVKNDATHQWLLIDNPFSYVNQRWEMWPGRERTRVDLKMSYELPAEGVVGAFGELVDLDKVTQASLVQLDTFLARVQAHFDPGLDPEKVAALGLRGESFKSLAQGYRTSIWVKARPETVESWLLDPKNTPAALREFRMEEKDYARVRDLVPGQVLYVPGTLEVAGLKARADLFLLQSRSLEGKCLRLYLVSLSTVARLEMRASAQSGGSVLTVDLMFEVPSLGSPEGLDLMVMLSGVPQTLAERARFIKEQVEAEGPALN